MLPASSADSPFSADTLLRRVGGAVLLGGSVWLASVSALVRAIAELFR